MGKLPNDWAAQVGNREVTLELYQIIRSGDAESAGDFITTTLIDGVGKAGALWDAVSLAAADLIYRHRTGGSIIGSGLIHAITSTNALRYGFDNEREDRLRLIQLLQAAGSVAHDFVGGALKQQRLREMDLVSDLKPLADAVSSESKSPTELFADLPFKSDSYGETNAVEREASDAACRKTFQYLARGGQEQDFLRVARSIICTKASDDPHDIKYPSAAFEDAFLVSPEWKPYILASTVHALHGPKSPDSKVYLQAKDAM